MIKHFIPGVSFYALELRGIDCETVPVPRSPDSYFVPGLEQTGKPKNGLLTNGKPTQLEPTILGIQIDCT